MEANGSPSHISTKIQLFILDYLDRAHLKKKSLHKLFYSGLGTHNLMPEQTFSLYVSSHEMRGT
jgi:hypothetical protein